VLKDCFVFTHQQNKTKQNKITTKSLETS